MSSPKIKNYNNYNFRADAANNNSGDNLVSPRSSLQSQPEQRPPLLKRRSSLESSQQQLDRYQYLPLTQERLAEKDRLDVLLDDRSIIGVKHIKRRRSISNGNLARNLYNEDNTSINIAAPYTKRRSDHSCASIDSPNSAYNSPVGHLNIRSNKYMTCRLSSSFTTNQDMLNTTNQAQRIGSSRAQTYGSLIDPQQQKTPCSRSIFSNSGWTPMQERQQQGPPRRFSGLVRLSVAHIVMRRKEQKKKRYINPNFMESFQN